MMLIYSKEKWRLKPEISLNLWHLQSTFLIGSCFILSNVSFLFLWTLWRNQDYFPDKMYAMENRTYEVFGRTRNLNWCLHLVMFFWHIIGVMDLFSKHVHLCVVNIGSCVSFILTKNLRKLHVLLMSVSMVTKVRYGVFHSLPQP